MRTPHPLHAAAAALAAAFGCTPHHTPPPKPPPHSAPPPEPNNIQPVTVTEPTTTTTPPTTTVVTAPPTTRRRLVVTVPRTTVKPRAAATETPSPGATTALVSWYGNESGSRTANGETFIPSQPTFAHKTLPFGTRLRFCGPLGCVVARCTDRGPFIAGRSYDLSRGAFAAVAPLSAGVARVTVEAA